MWIFGLLVACSWFSQRSWDTSPDAIAVDRYALLFALALFQIPSIWRSLTIWSLIRRGEIPFWGPGRRMTSLQIIASAASHLPWVPLLWLTYGRVWTWSAVGVPPADRLGWALAAGAIAVPAVFGVQQFVSRFVPPTYSRLPLKLQRRLFLFEQPRGALARGLRFLDTGFIAPLSEDLIHRGFLVYLLGETCGSHALAIAAGWLLFVLVHLYQGWWSAVILQFFFWASIGLLYSPYGLVAVMTLHVGFYMRLFEFERQYLLLQFRSLRTVQPAEQAPPETQP
jgi:hypothetical protein